MGHLNGMFMNSNNGHKIEYVFCFVATDENGDEGVPAIELNGTMMPLMGSDLARLNSLKPIAREMQKRSGKHFRLYRFDNKIEEAF